MPNTKNKYIKYKKSKRLNKKNNTKNTKKYKNTKYIQKGGDVYEYDKALNILKNNEDIQIIQINENLSSEQITEITDALKTNTAVKNLLLININIDKYRENLLKFANALKTNKILQQLHINIPIPNSLSSKEIYDIFDDAFNINSTIIYLDIDGLNDIDKKKLLNRSFIPKLDKIKLNNDNSEIIPFIKEVITNEQKIKKNKLKFNYDELVIELCENRDEFDLLMKQNYNEGFRQFNLCKESTYVNDANTKIIIVDLHGAIKNNMFKLPQNINIVFLSPIKYLTCSNLIQVKKYLIQNKIQEYLANPSCYNKDTNSEIFNQSVIYYGGQYCINLNLVRDSITINPKETAAGLFLYDNNNFNFNTGFDINNTNTLNTEYRNLLSTLLEDISNTKYNSTYDSSNQYTLFFTSCRDISLSDYENLDNNKLTFYEQTLQAVNFKIQFDILGNPTYKDTSEIEYLNCKYPKNTKMKLYSSLRNTNHIQKKRNNSKVKTNKISSRINVEINDDTILYYDNNDNTKSITIREIKKLISNSKTRLEKFNSIYIYFDLYFSCWTDPVKAKTYYNPCFKKKNDLLIYIFNNDFQLAFVFLIYMILTDFLNQTMYNIFFNEFINSNSEKLNTTLDLSSLELRDSNLYNLKYLVNDELTEYKITELILDNNDFSEPKSFEITVKTNNFYKDIVSLSLANTQLDLTSKANIETLKHSIKQLPKLKKLELSQTTDNKDDYSKKTLFVF